VLILKSFKSRVLEVFILKGLRTDFTKVRILRDLGEKELKVESLKLNGERRGELNTETQSTQRSETGTDLEMEAGLAESGRWTTSNGSVEGRVRANFNAEGTEFAEKEGTPPPRVFFERVANTGLMLDAASRESTKNARLRVEGLELNGERFGELNTETQSTQRSETGTDLEREVGLAASIGNGSTDFYYCQGIVL
jgi:hypothetical protein